jgi:hypothetical protein
MGEIAYHIDENIGIVKKNLKKNLRSQYEVD